MQFDCIICTVHQISLLPPRTLPPPPTHATIITHAT